MLSVLKNLGLLLFLALLSACASVPLKPSLPAPKALPVLVVRSDRPLVALVLGSGGTRGLAHVGVIKVLEENHIPVDMVVGTSVGSVVGALYAGGIHAPELERLALNLEQSQITDFKFSLSGFIHGVRLQDFVNRELHDRSIEQLDKPFAAVATELASGKATVFNHGNVGIAVRASSSIPGVFLPITIDGVEYVDGGVIDPVPVRVAQQMGADIVIAVDVSSMPQNGSDLSNALQIWIQTTHIMQQAIAQNEIKAAQVVIRPQIGMTPEINPVSKQTLVKAGEEAANAALPEIRYWLRRVANEKLLQRPLK